MPSLLVRVDQQRWDGPTQRFQNPGEEVLIQHEDEDLFRRRCLEYAFTATPVNGDWPEFNPKQKGWVGKAVDHVKSIAGRATGQTFCSLKELNEPAEVELKKDTKGWVCPECDKHYKSEKGLLRHFKRSGHGK